MNERDSEALACLLEDCGYLASGAEEDADVIIFNTCSVRDQAERKVLGKVGILKRLKKQRPDVKLGIIGCMAQNYGQDLLDELPHLDFVVGTDRLHFLPEILEDVFAGGRQVADTATGQDILGGLSGHREGQFSAYVSVMRGCNQFCTYCIVPYVRGREKSREIADIVSEVEGLARKGVKEVCLLGQNVTAYGLAEARRREGYSTELSPFADLLRAVHQVPGLERIRFTSPHPRFMNRAFVEAVTELPKVCEQFHVPLQSGSDRILKAMHRGYTVDTYLDVVNQIKQRLPAVAFSTDVIVGFPGETEEDFERTRRVMDEVGFDMAYIFKYSPRGGTKAAELADDVPQEVKERRNQILLKDLEERVRQQNRAYLGQVVEVLVTGPSKRNAERWSGRSRTNKTCIFEPGPGMQPGQLVKLSIDRTTAHSLFGTLLKG